MQTVRERHPNEIAERKHQAKAVADDVDGGQHRGLHVVAIEHIESLGECDEYDGVCNFSEVPILLHNEGQIKNHPAKHTRANFSPSLDVDLTEDRKRNARVQLTADEPVVQDVAAVATSCKLAHAGVLGMLDGEGGHVDVGSQGVRGQDVGCEKSKVVLRDEGPNAEFSTLDNCPCSKDDEDEDAGAPRCELLVRSGDQTQDVKFTIETVLQPSSSPQLCAFGLFGWEESVQS